MDGAPHMPWSARLANGESAMDRRRTSFLILVAGALLIAGPVHAAGASGMTLTQGWAIQSSADVREDGAALSTVAGFAVCLYLWLSLRRPAMIAGSAWLVAGILYGAWKTRGFRGNVISFDVPPEESKQHLDTAPRAQPPGK